jgi:Carboxypeptidase regulatory-like domain/TonB dependent receptor
MIRTQARAESHIPRNRARSRALLLAMSLGLCDPGIASGQQFRGALVGTVTDPVGALVPDARVTLTGIATNTTLATRTNGDGFYVIEYIPPGRYRLRVEASGFQPVTLEAIEVRVGDRLTLDHRLAIGPLESTVIVAGDATPLLQTGSASIGQVVDRRRLEELPLADGNPFILARVAPGVAFTDVNNLRFTRAFDNGGTSSISANGVGSQASEFTLDGLPDNAAFGRQIAYVPPAEAVHEFKVVTSSFDAQQGHSAGAHVDVVTRSGTNRPAGSAYWFNRHEALAANEFFVNGNPNCERDADGDCKKNPLRYNRWGGTFGGPVMLPGPSGVWSGKDRLFFFAAYEGLRQTTPATNTFTVPTETMRNGDFSALLPATGIYDPATAFVRPDGRVERLPFAGNVIPSDRIDAIGRNYLSYWPLPNLSCGDAQCRNNLIAPVPRTDHFYSVSFRADATLTQHHRLFGRFSHNRRKQHTEGWSGVINGVDPTTSDSFRINDAMALDHVYTASSGWILNVRGGLTRFESKSSRAAEGVFDATTLGFPTTTTDLFAETGYLPQFNITNFNPNTGGGTVGGALSGRQVFDVYAFQPTVTSFRGGHRFHAGYDVRVYRAEEIPATHAAGLYEFDARQVATRQFSDSPAAAMGQELAALLLGLPSGGRVERNATRNNQLIYHAVFFQDDWKVSSRFTLNLGLRWDMETAPTERHDRNTRGFDFVFASPIEAAARAAYAANPIPQVPVDAFRVKGGLLFVDENNRGFYEPDTSDFQPRIGVVYELDAKTVVRGGFALFSVPFYIDAVNQVGFSQSTLLVPTVNAGLTFNADLANPFPSGVLEPPGASLGLATSLGQAVNTVPIERRNTRARRYTVSLQRELAGRVVAEVAFVRNENYDVRVANVELNPIPREYLTTRNQRDPAVDSFLSAQVPNPFRGLLTGTGLNGATVERQQLLRPFPHFTSLLAERYDGEATYNSLQLRIERRFSQGYTVNGGYTFSRLSEAVTLLNPTDSGLEHRRSRDDYPHRLVISGIYELPVGRGRRVLTDARGLLDALVGGWQVQGIYQYQSGRPLAWGNVAYFGDPDALRTNIESGTVSTVGNPTRVVFDTSQFFSPGVDIRLRNNIRTFPSTLPGFRSQAINQLDLSAIKNVALAGGPRLQVRVEFLNATNTPLFGEPNLDPTSSSFGRVTSQVNLPRNIQIGLRCDF